MRKLKSTLLVLALMPTWILAQRDWTVPFKSEQAFLENQGQFDALLPEVDILFGIDHGFGWQVMMDKSGAHFINRKFTKVKNVNQMDSRGITESTIVRQEWVGSNPNLQVAPLQLRPDYFTYAVQEGNTFRDLNHVSGYAALRYPDLYPGIHLEYSAPEEGGIKYALDLDAGADPSVIRLRYAGSTPSLDADGNVILPTVLGNLMDKAPVANYLDGSQESIPCQFQLQGNEVRFQLGNYDNSRPVRIDPWTVNPALPAPFNRAFEVDADAAGNVYVFGGGMGYNLKKYNSAGTLQWTHVSPWDTSNAWFGELLVMPAGDVFITSGSAAKIRRLTTAGATVFTNNGPFFNVDEYWSLTLNCDNTKLISGGSRIIGLTSPQGHIFNLNMGSGAQLAGSPINIAPTGMNEVRCVNRSSANGYIYALTNNNLVCLDNNLATVFSIANGYNLPYYSPAYMAQSVQGVNAVDGNATAVYTSNGAIIERRDPFTGAVQGSVAITGGGFTGGFFGSGATNSGLALDACGNVYAGSSNQVIKYNGTLVQQANVATTGAVYDVVVAPGNTVIWGGNGFVTSNTSLAACVQMTYSCVVLPVEFAHFEATCVGKEALLNWSLTNPADGVEISLEHSPNGTFWEKESDLEVESDLQWETPVQNPNWFYRVAFRNADGTVNYSPTASIPDCGTVPPSMQAIPSMASMHTNLVVNEPMNGEFILEILNTAGQQMNSYRVGLEQAYSLKVDLEGLKNGFYFIRLRSLDGTFSESTKVLKL